MRKHRDRYLVGTEGDPTVVSLGRLYGERLDGTAFDDIRYADVFVLRNGLIVEQHVYNDLSESGCRGPVPLHRHPPHHPPRTAPHTTAPRPDPGPHQPVS